MVCLIFLLCKKNLDSFLVLWYCIMIGVYDRVLYFYLLVFVIIVFIVVVMDYYFVVILIL